MKHTVAKGAAATAALLSVIAIGSAQSGHATAAVKPPCVWVVGTGTAGDDITTLKCINPDKITYSPTRWSGSGTLLTRDGTYIASFARNEGGNDLWYWDDAMVFFGDLKAKLIQTNGYTNVTMGSGDYSGYVVANYDRPSKKKY